MSYQNIDRGSHQYTNVPSAEQNDVSMAYPSAEDSGPQSQHQSFQAGAGQMSGSARAYQEYVQSSSNYGERFGGYVPENLQDFTSYPSGGTGSILDYYQQASPSKKNKILFVLVVLLAILFTVVSHQFSTPTPHLPHNTFASNTDPFHEPSHEPFHMENEVHHNNERPPEHNVEEPGENPSEREPNLKIAYLLTYPMSGSTYTKFLIEKTTNTAIATNYESEALRDDGDRLIRVFPLPDENKGTPDTAPIGSPFWGSGYGTAQTPKDYVLTMAHCTGYCLPPCGPEDYIHTQSTFEESCRTIVAGERYSSNSKEPLVPKSEVKKVVHLIRDPYSNVVSRFHEFLRAAHRRGQPNLPPDNKEGFREWCRLVNENSIDEVQLSPLIAGEMKFLMRSVPCRDEFYKYFAWHNHVVEMIWNEGYESMQVYYEHYRTEAERESTASEVAKFLQLTAVDLKQVPNHLIVRMYGDYFEESEKENVKALFNELALKKAAPLLERYF